MTSSVCSPGGGIEVRTTERGIPVALRLNPGELRASPEELARDILALCRLSAARAQVRRRRRLTAQGFDVAVLRALNLSSEDELAAAEARMRRDDPGGAPRTWTTP